MNPITESVFDHETRKMIFNYIATNPGVAFTTLKDVYNLSDGTLRYHLEYLTKAEQITSDLENGRRCYYPQRTDISISKLLENRVRTNNFTDKQLKIIETIRNFPGISQNELTQKLRMSRFTVTYNINKFVNIGLVKKSHNGKNVYYECMTDEALKHEVLIRLVMKMLNGEISEEQFFELNRKLARMK